MSVVEQYWGAGCVRSSATTFGKIEAGRYEPRQDRSPSATGLDKIETRPPRASLHLINDKGGAQNLVAESIAVTVEQSCMYADAREAQDHRCPY
jgi:hypothetical protein